MKRNPYYYSKVLAEKAAWELAKELNIDMVVVNPVITIGPSLKKSINPSNKILLDILTGEFPAVLDFTWGFVDVRDVARAHVDVMVTRDAKGRYLCGNVVLTMKVCTFYFIFIYFIYLFFSFCWKITIF